MQENNELKNLRRNYDKDQLLESNIEDDPFVQFKNWFKIVLKANIIEPNAMSLATSTKEGVPSVRIVLLKGVDDSGFIFFTNYNSRKGSELLENPFASILFWWKEFERQVRLKEKLKRLVEKNLKIILILARLKAGTVRWLQNRAKLLRAGKF